MPSDDLQSDPDAVLAVRVDPAGRSVASFAQALPESLRRLFPAALARDRLPPELAFLVAEGVTPDLVEPFAHDAAVAGVTGEAALFASGLSDELYYRMLARHVGAHYLEGPLRLLGGIDATAAASVGNAPLAPNRYGFGHVQAPRGCHLRELLRRRRGRRDHRLAITTPRRLDAMLRRHDAERLATSAEEGLAEWDASLSARDGPSPSQVRLGLVVAVLAGLGIGARPFGAVLAASLALFLLFAAAVVQRLVVVWAARAPSPDLAGRRMADRDLPVYTLLVPLFHEARVLPALVRALDALDYPRAKLDIKLLLEEGDHETIAAAGRLGLPDRYDVMVLRDGHPRTKPRALNAGLDWARGDLVVVYDAEDRPQPAQLRAAVRRFAEEPGRLACLQARLVIDHADETWITRLFAFEYAALFGVVKPGLAALGLPVPLGGTSNHFRGLM